MPDDNLQEPLQPFPPMLNHIIAEPVGEHLARQRRNGHPRGFPLQDVAEVFEIGVAPADGAVLEFEGGDVGAADDFVVGVHASVGAVRLRVLDLEGTRQSVDGWEGGCLWWWVANGKDSLGIIRNGPLFLGSFRGAHRSLRSSAGGHLALPAWCGGGLGRHREVG